MLKRFWLSDYARDLAGLVGFAVTAWLLHRAGWPWWAWAPAAALAGIVAVTAVIISWFEYQRATYEADAARTKERLRNGEMEP
jgi:hypothetical protein